MWLVSVSAVCALMLGMGVFLVIAVPLEADALERATSLLDQQQFEMGALQALRRQLLHWLGVMCVSAGATGLTTLVDFETWIGLTVLGVVFLTALRCVAATRPLRRAVSEMMALSPEKTERNHDADE